MDKYEKYFNGEVTVIGHFVAPLIKIQECMW